MCSVPCYWPHSVVYASLSFAMSRCWLTQITCSPQVTMSRARQPPLVTGISPKEGAAWTKVTIRGENLGTGPADLIGNPFSNHIANHTVCPVLCNINVCYTVLIFLWGVTSIFNLVLFCMRIIHISFVFFPYSNVHMCISTNEYNTEIYSLSTFLDLYTELSTQDINTLTN